MTIFVAAIKFSLHILHITRESGSDARYGIGKSLAPVMQALRERGNTVEILDGDTARNMPPGWLASWVGRKALALIRHSHVPAGSESTAAHVIVNMLAERAAIAWAAAQQASKRGVTHVHSHDPVLGFLYGHFAFLTGATRRWGVTEHGFGAYVQERQGVVIPVALKRLLQKWELKVARTASWLCAPSHAGLLQLARDLQMTTVVANNIFPSNWHVVGHAKPELRKYDRIQARRMLGIAEDEFIVLAVGQIVPMKRFELLIQACGLIDEARRPNLLILGEGDTQAMFDAARQAGMGGKLRIEVTDDIGLYFSASDLYASSSATESFGMANCEALSAGLPSVCTAVGAVPEIVGDAAWLVSDDPLEMALALDSLRGNDGLRRHFAEKARRWGIGWQGPCDIACQMERIYAGNS
ncbi:MAG: glycosyltransferase family 4 protein [Polaromonas sp.]